MNSPWVIRLAGEDAAAVACLRLSPGVEVAENRDGVWLRGRQADEMLDRALHRLPAEARYEWLAGDRLREFGSRIPSATLPTLRWGPLAEWLRVELPRAALPASSPRPAPLALVRTPAESEPALLMTEWNDWERFALSAAAVRLRPLRFAVRTDGAVLIRGRPLPPLPGLRFVLRGTMAVPAGYGWQPAVPPEVLGRCLRLAAGALALWFEDGTYARLEAEQFVAATRAAVRATAEAMKF